MHISSNNENEMFKGNEIKEQQKLKQFVIL